MRQRVLPALLLAAAASPAAGQFVGLPNTGKLDPQRVLDQRYPARAVAKPAAQAQADPGPSVDLVPHGFAGGITGVAIDGTLDAPQRQVPVSFGQVFAPGDFGSADRLAGRLADGAALPLQVDVKARHPDGSVRHAVISALLPALAPHQPLMLTLAKAKAADAATAPTVRPADLIAQGLHACVSASLGGKVYSACAERLLAGAGPAAWLSGPIASEWLVAAPLKDERGAEHPQLSARFALRWYPQAHKARIDLSVDNDWAGDSDARDLVYDAQVTLDGKTVYGKRALDHLHGARWRKVFWWGDAPGVQLRRDSAYLMATRALPNYDTRVAVHETALADLARLWSGPAIEPMGPGVVTPSMAAIGGRGDLGLLPSWAALYLLSMDPRAGRVTFGSADLAGSWPIHRRERQGDRPARLPAHAEVHAEVHAESAAVCAGQGACVLRYQPDRAHQPNLAYLPYLLSGDHYDLEELQFWAAWNAPAPPRDSVPAQAWGLRTLGEAAYITPDDDPLKAYFTGLLAARLERYAASAGEHHGAASLGALDQGGAAGAKASTLAPWQDDLFTASLGHLAELGFAQAQRLLAWKVRFPIARMLDPGACWIFGTASQLSVGGSGSMADAYAASVPAEIRALPCGGAAMARSLGLAPGEMAGFAASPSSFVAHLQPALAYGADAGGQAGKDAWRRFMARSVMPDYGSEPQFAIVPRAASEP